MRFNISDEYITATLRSYDRTMDSGARSQGRAVTLSLLDVFRRAHELKEIRDASPLVTYGLYRLLQAIVQDLVNPGEKREWFVTFGRIASMILSSIDFLRWTRIDLISFTQPTRSVSPVTFR